MCGIVGFAYKTKKESNEEMVRLLESMNQALFHRGPDDAGVYLSDAENGTGGLSVGLAHRRLSIIDLSQAGRQPLSNEDGTIWITYNGEFYNFRDYIPKLKEKGHRFISQTDTEVIVHLYEEYGINCLEKMDGMFAFCLWDKKREKIFLVRDRMGIKPLYYAEVDNGLAFASEIKALLRHPGIKRDLDEFALSQYLSFEYVPSPSSIFKQIKKLPAAHFLAYDGGSVQVKQYWEVEYNPTPVVKKEEEYAEELIDILRYSVKQMLVSDVPLGVFLSGGIDSSLITALMVESAAEKVKTFSIGFQESSFDESRYAERVSDYLSTKHYIEELSARTVLDLVPKIMTFLDEPFGDASVFSVFLLSEFTRKHVKVVLCGDGGDELFAGYSTYQAHKFYERFYKKLPGLIKNKMIPGLAKRLPVSEANFSFDFKLKRFISGSSLSLARRHAIWMGSFSEIEKNDLLTTDMQSKIKGEDAYRILEDYIQSFSGLDFIEQVLQLDRRFYLQEDILTKNDRATMANSLECRVPFLNHHLVQFAANIPSELKLKGLTSKYILKKSARGLIPEDISNREKKGFGIPLTKWIKGELKEFILDVFNSSKIKKEGVFNTEYIQRLLNEHFEGRKDNRKTIYTLLNFQLWYDTYVKK